MLKTTPFGITNTFKTFSISGRSKNTAVMNLDMSTLVLQFTYFLPYPTYLCVAFISSVQLIMRFCSYLGNAQNYKEMWDLTDKYFTFLSKSALSSSTTLVHLVHL